MKNLIGILISIIYIVVVFLISKSIAKKGEEISRKFVHIMLCNIWIIYLIFINSLIVACILPISFIIINTLSYKYKLIKSMEREKNDGFGTIYYATSILSITIFTYVLKKPMMGLTGIMIMGYGDGLAAIVGQSVNSPKYKIGNTTESIAGSLTMFVVSFIISLIVLNLLGANYCILRAIGMAIASMILEAISTKGIDNITVPIILTLLTFLSV